MKSEEMDKFAEEWLDAALESYEAEPQLGLETRILANMREHEQPSRRLRVRSWQVLAIAAAIALLAVGVAVWQHGRQTTVAHQGAISSATVSVAPTVGSHPERAVDRATAQPLYKMHALRASASKNKNVERPKREHFPSAVPLSEEERWLLAYVRSTPKAELALVAQLQEERQKRAELEARQVFQEGMK